MGSKFLCMSTGNIIKDPKWYGVQGIRRGGNNDDQCFLARAIKMNKLDKAVIKTKTYKK